LGPIIEVDTSGQIDLAGVTAAVCNLLH
jgi:hypothetical protein